MLDLKEFLLSDEKPTDEEMEEFRKEFTSLQEGFRQKWLEHFRRKMLAFLGGIQRKYVPELYFDVNSEQSFTGADEKRGNFIHIGLACSHVLRLIVRDFDFEAAELLWVEYVLYHECRHILSTSDTAFAWAYFRCISGWISDFRVKFGLPAYEPKTEMECRNVLKQMHDDGYPVPPYKTLATFAKHLTNGTEDGRCDEISSSVYPKFARERAIFRGMEWEGKHAGDEEGKPESDFIACMNEILSLATTQYTRRGYYFVYPEGERVDKTMSTLIPLISDACLYSSDCHEAMKDVVEMSRVLSPLLMDEDFTSPPSPPTPGDGSEENDNSDPHDQSQSESNSGGDGQENGQSEKGSGNGQSGQKPGDQNQSPKDEHGLDEIMNAHGPEGFSKRPEKTEEKPDEEDRDGNTKGPLGKSKLSGKGTAEQGENGSAATSGREKNPENSDTAGIIDLEEQAEEERILEELRQAAEAMVQELEARDNVLADDDDPYTGGEIRNEDSSAEDLAKMIGIAGFREYPRGYDLTVETPWVVQERSNSLRNQTIDEFRKTDPGLVRRRTSGMIDPRRVVFLGANQLEVFSKKKPPEETKTDALIGLDTSGSMGDGAGSKRMFASEACSMTELAYRDVEGIDMKIVAFDYDTHVVHQRIKNWGEKSAKSFSYNWYYKGRTGCCNADYLTIRVLAQELLARNNGADKLLIIISDGLPCDCGEGDPEKLTHQAIEEARQAGITVIGIYISDEVKKSEKARYQAMYGESAVFATTDALADELAAVMRQNIKK